MQFHCAAYGELPLSISWSRNGSSLVNDTVDQQVIIYEEQFEEGGFLFVQSTIQICNTDTVEDTGVYSCIAEYVDLPRSDIASFELTVTGEL